MTKLSIYQKLLNVQRAVKGLKADDRTRTGVSFEYLTADKLFRHIKPVMNKEGLILKQEVLSIVNTRIDYQTKDSSKSEMMSTVNMKFTWIDCETGEIDENLFTANGMNGWVQGVGSALAYGERYFILKYFHIVTDEDDFEGEKPQPSAPVTPKTQPPAPQPPQPNTQKMPVLPELSPSSDGWPAAIDWISKGNNVDEIRKKYVLSKRNEEILKKAALERVA